MTENTTTVVENVEGQMDLVTGEVVETAPEMTVEDIVTELAGSIEEPITAYKIANVINGTFELIGIDKKVPPQMMYNYTLKGMIVKGKKGSAKDIRYTRDEVVAFATRYVNKFVK